MHIISPKMLRDFWRKHPDAEQPMRNWHTITEQARFGSFADVRRNFGNADYVTPFTVFNIGGNNYRLISVVRYGDRKIFVRWVMTHDEYDNWCKLHRQGKV